MSVGETLAAARREAGRSIEELSAQTRIRGPIITAIERDDFSSSGGDFYARGHIRSLAHALGIDPGPLVEEYDATHATAPPTPHEVFESEAVRRPRGAPNWTAAMAVAAAVVVVLALISVLTPGERRDRQATPMAGGASASRSAAPPATARAPVKKPPPRPIALAPVSLRLQVTGAKSWVRVTNSAGAAVFQGVLEGGQAREFTDKAQLRVILGDAGAVRLTVNGKDLGVAGAPGSVVRLVFKPGNPTLAGG